MVDATWLDEPDASNVMVVPDLAVTNDAVKPLLSVTVSVTKYVPACENWCRTTVPVATPSLPNVQVKMQPLHGTPSSVTPRVVQVPTGAHDASNVTTSPNAGAAGLTLKAIAHGVD